MEEQQTAPPARPSHVVENTRWICGHDFDLAGPCGAFGAHTGSHMIEARQFSDAIPDR
jgi:hypothetical protein